MEKNLTFEYEGKEYKLEFTRKAIEQMENRGFVISEVMDRPMTLLPQLFAGSFIANHRFTKSEVIESIYGKLKDKQALLEKLIEMYNEPLEVLMGEESDEGNGLEWKASF